MKKIYFLTCLFGLTISCQKEEIISANTDSSISDQEPVAIAFNDLPANIKTIFDNTKNIKFKSGELKSKNPFGTAKTNSKIIKNINEKGIESYTIALNKINSTVKSEFRNLLYFDNLSVTDLGNGKLIKYIFRYIPDKNWYELDKQMSTYTGKIEIHNLSGTKLSDMTLSQGKQIAKNQLKLNDELICMYDLVSTFCTELAMEGDTNTTMHCTYTYALDYCVNGSSGGGSTGGTINTNTNQGSTWNGDTTSGGNPGIPDDGEIDTTPILPDEEDVSIINRINDPCAKLIYNQLLLASMSNDLPPTISYDSINGLTTTRDFSRAILNIFNDSQKFNYDINNSLILSTSNAKTDPTAVYNSATGKYTITTSFNQNYFDDATDLSMARTMIHESIHAYLIYSLKAEPFGDMKKGLEAYINENNFPNTFDNHLNHNFMAQFVHAIAYQLQGWDHNHGTGGVVSWQYYLDMAWGGLSKDPDNPGSFYNEFEDYLQNTVDSMDLIDKNARDIMKNTIKNRIQDRLTSEKENYNDSSQNGNKNDCQ